MSSSLTFSAAIAGFLLFAASAQAKECYEWVDDPANSNARWTITVNDDSTLTWNQGDRSIEMDTISAGTGMPGRAALDPTERRAYPYLFHKGDLIFDMSIYTPVSCN